MNDSALTPLTSLLKVITSANNDWGSLHPVIVHFPIALLLAAPLFIVCGLLFRKSQKVLFISALSLMLLGTIAIFVSVSTGEHAAEILEPAPAFTSALETHLQLGEQSRLNFTVLSAIFFTLIILRAKCEGKLLPSIPAIFIGVFLIGYLYCLMVLFNAAHYGGKLVHQYGIKSTLYSNGK